jgi:hypothetical protein
MEDNGKINPWEIGRGEWHRIKISQAVTNTEINSGSIKARNFLV